MPTPRATLPALTADQVRRYVAREASAAGLAREAGSAEWLVLRALRAAGVDTSARRGGQGVPPPAIPAELLGQYQRREITVADVATALGCGHVRAARGLRAALGHLAPAGRRPGSGKPRAPKPPRPRPNEERDREARRLREQGLTLREIGERLGLCRQRVHQILTGT